MQHYILTGSFTWTRSLAPQGRERLAQIFCGIVTPDMAIWPPGGIGYLRDGLGLSSITDFRLDHTSLAFTKQYVYKPGPIRYSFTKEIGSKNKQWTGVWKRGGTSRGEATCYVFTEETNMDFINDLIQGLKTYP